MGFSIGVISLAAAFLGLFAVCGNFGVRRVAAWYNKTEPPKDRVHVGAVIAFVVCFILGSVAQPQFDKIGACTDAGYKLGECVFAVNH